MNGAKRYQAALRAIRRRHKSASYRDAQAVYRLLRQGAAAPVSAKQIRSARSSTTGKLLTRARDLGSRTARLTAKQQRAEERRAREFNRKNQRREGRPGRGKTKTQKAREQKSAGQKARAPQEVFTLAEFRRAVQEAHASGETFDEIEIETSPDYFG